MIGLYGWYNMFTCTQLRTHMKHVEKAEKVGKE